MEILGPVIFQIFLTGIRSRSGIVMVHLSLGTLTVS